MEIIFVRHGKPLNSPLPFLLNAKDFECWLSEYQLSQIDVNSRPCDYLCKLMENSLIISSNLNRAKHSANIAINISQVKNAQPVQSFCLLDEVHIPYFNIPLKMPLSSWLVINRFLWFVGMHGNVESFKQARHRSSLMVNELLSLVETNKRIVIFGHGLMNRFIYTRLIELGWTKVKTTNRNQYWSFQVIHK